jgi:hypothetical protein
MRQQFSANRTPKNHNHIRNEYNCKKDKEIASQNGPERGGNQLVTDRLPARPLLTLPWQLLEFPVLILGHGLHNCYTEPKPCFQNLFVSHNSCIFWP